MQKLRFWILICGLFMCISSTAQINTDRLLDIGRNALYFEDYVVSIQYFNQVIKAKPHLPEPYIFRSYAKLNLEDYDGAISDCDAALNINPFLPQAYYCRGYAYRQINKMPQSTHDFEKALEFDPGNISANNLLIENLIQQKLTDEALAVCDSFLSVYPRYSDAYILKSQIRVSNNDTIAAIAELDTALILNKKNDLAYAIRAMMYYSTDQNDIAIKDINQAINYNPNRSDYYGNRAIIEMDMNNIKGAMNDYDTAIKIDNKNPLAYFNRALLRSRVGDTNRAIDDYSTSIALEKNNYTAYFQRALLNIEIKDYKKAINDFNTILKKYPDFVPAIYGRAEAKKNMGDKTGADKDSYLAMQIEKEIKSGQRKARQGTETDIAPSAEGDAIVQELNKKTKDKYKSDIRGQVQDKDINIEPLNNFVIGTPDTTNQFVRKTLYLPKLAEYNKTHKTDLKFCVYEDDNDATDLSECFKKIEQLNDTLKVNPKKEGALVRRAYYLSQVQDYNSAIQDYDMLLAYYPKNALAYFNRANARLKELKDNKQHNAMPLAEYTLAISDFKMANKLNQNMVYALYNIAYIYMVQKDFANALVYLNQAIEIYPDFAEAYYNRGLIYLFKTEKEKGREDLSKAGELGLHNAYNIIKRYGN